MSNRNGMPIWYELLSTNPDASTTFYEHVIGWTIGAKPSGDFDYRTIAVGDSGVAGLMHLTRGMAADGAKATWLFYIGVDDVDATVAAITEKGGTVIKPAWDMPGVGRMAFVTDPQGNPFYVMTSASNGTSTAFDRFGMGKCNWNELVTSDHATGDAFYADVFGWTYPGRMTMPGDMGDYVFVSVGDVGIGATMHASGDAAPGWRFYFRTPDIDATVAKVGEAGGKVLMGPHDVPGGDRIILATDSHGVVFGAVGPG
ncbi:VOC family protein [Novosphingobium sp.]|uniref:VOC family protein n=1 Tax=Novosphingobium sp. TaxID=1874826 RepID=UPI003D146512